MNTIERKKYFDYIYIDSTISHWKINQSKCTVYTHDLYSKVLWIYY